LNPEVSVIGYFSARAVASTASSRDAFPLGVTTAAPVTEPAASTCTRTDAVKVLDSFRSDAGNAGTPV
jgi:hypothetical protein